MRSFFFARFGLMIRHESHDHVILLRPFRDSGPQIAFDTNTCWCYSTTNEFSDATIFSYTHVDTAAPFSAFLCPEPAHDKYSPEFQAQPDRPHSRHTFDLRPYHHLTSVVSFLAAPVSKAGSTRMSGYTWILSWSHFFLCSCSLPTSAGEGEERTQRRSPCIKWLCILQ